MKTKLYTPKVIIIFLFIIFISIPIKLSSQSNNIFQSIIDQIGGKNSLQLDYINGKKRVFYIALPGVPIDAVGTKAKMKILIDLCDIAGVTREGRDGWVTIWVDISASQDLEFMKLFPVSFGLQLRSFDPNTPDSPLSLFDFSTNLNIPVMPVNLFSVSSNGGVKTIDFKFGASSSISVSESFTVHGLSFEMKIDALNSLLYNCASPGITLDDYSVRLTKSLSNPDNSSLTMNPFISFRFATLDDDPTDTRIQSITAIKLVQGLEGIVNVDVIVKTSDYYYMRVWGLNPLTAYIPKWDWDSKSTEAFFFEANKNYTFKFYVTPETRSEDFSFWLYQKDENIFNLETYKIIEKIRTTLYALPVGTDVTPPIVNFISPVNNSSVQNSFNVVLQASDANSGISHVDLLLNGEYVDSKFTSPFEYTIHTSNLSQGIFRLAARAYDRNGNGSEANLNLVNMVTGSPITVNPTVLSFMAGGETKPIVVNSTGSWTSNGLPTWISLNPSTGNSGSVTVNVLAQQNTTSNARSAYTTFTSGTATTTLAVSQLSPLGLVISTVNSNKSIFVPSESATITIALDGQVTGASVTFKLNNGPVETCPEIGNGIYQKVFTVPSTTGSHNIVINASKTGFISANPYPFIIQVANAGLIVTANPSTILYTGSSTSKITATLLNSQGQAMPGVNIQFMQSPSGALNPGSAVTNAQGIATTDFIPDNTGSFKIDATAQTTNNPKGSVLVTVNSAGSSTYTIKLTNIVSNRTITSVTHELIPKVTFTSNGELVEATNCKITTNLGSFQNGTQTYTGVLGDGGYGAGQVSPHPLLTTTTSGTATITITVGSTISTFTIPMNIGLLPQVQPFYTLTDANSTIDTERELDWTSDGKLFAYSPGKIINFPTFKQIYSGPIEITKSLSFSKNGQKIVMGRASDNPVFYIYNTVTNKLSSYNPSYRETNSVAWSDETDEIKFALANSYTGYMNQIIIYTGEGLVQSYLTIDETLDIILAIDWKGDYLAAVTSGGAIYMFNTSTMTRMWKSTIDRPFKYGVSISPDKSKVSVISRKYSGYNNLYIFNIESATPIGQYGLGNTNGRFYSVEWSPDGTKIVCAGYSGYLRIVDPSNGQELYDLATGTTAEIYGVSWSSQNIIAAIYGTTVKFYAPFDYDSPEINISYPQSGFTTTYDTVRIKGSVKDLIGIQTAEIKLNSSSYVPITLQADGSFEHILNINQAQNEIKIKAVDRGGRMSEMTRSVSKIVGSLAVNTVSVMIGSTINSSGSFNITSNIPWTIANSSSWLNINPASGSFDQSITLSANSMNSSTTTARSSIITINGTGAAPKTVTVTQAVSPPLKPILLSPLDNSTGISTFPTFNWIIPDGATSYRLEVSLNAAFSITVFDQSNITSNSFPLSGLGNNVQYFWRVKSTNSGGSSVWTDAWKFTTDFASGIDPVIPPSSMSLNQNYPNPFSQSTKIEFYISKASQIEISIYNSIGIKITDLVNKYLEPGLHTYDWIPPFYLENGIYYYQLRSNNSLSAKKMLFIK